ncbi:MAG: DUF21 domain-containing protein [Dehalococcoidales bacterium]|nr:DUF21 domain-containing protein [Dehalococcoidales bacterium]
MSILTWIFIILCISQSAMFSGLNLAFFSLSKLQLEIGAAKNNADARRVLAFRKDSNFLLVTILWGNVAVNVLLALLSGSVLSGVLAFLFSTVLITMFGEIIPQAYFSRHALRMASLLAPILRIYQFILFPLTKPTALILDKWLGVEAINYFKEADLNELVKMHVSSSQTDNGKVEGMGVLNFLNLDDLPLSAEGEVIDPKSIIILEFRGNKPIFPNIESSYTDTFLRKIHSSQKKWIIVVDPENTPKIVLESDGFLRDALFNKSGFNPYSHCHHPIILNNINTKLGKAISLLKVNPTHYGDDVIDKDIILLWSTEKRIITGSDILGRLLRGIVQSNTIS